MADIFGILGVNDHQRIFLSTLGQGVVYDAANEFLAEWNADLQAALPIFVQEQTTKFKERFMLPGGGRLQRVAAKSAPATAKASGSWDVAYPLEQFATALGWDRVDFAYMSVQDFNLHLQNQTLADIGTLRHEMLKRIFKNTNTNFVDQQGHGSLTIVPLANTDGTLYPPVAGSETDADDEHYLASGYVSADISDTNNPYITLRNELVEHTGGATLGGEDIVVFINKAQTTVTEELTDYDPVVDRFIIAGDDTDQPFNLPAGIPGMGRTVGRTNGVWVVEWAWIPEDYMIAVSPDGGPLKWRIDEEGTGLSPDFQLVSEHPTHPLSNSVWERRFGFGTGNRLGAAVMKLTAGSYTIPTIYA